jgi:hypothetical protein
MSRLAVGNADSDVAYLHPQWKFKADGCGWKLNSLR